MYDLESSTTAAHLRHPVSVLLVEDDLLLNEALTRVLQDAGYAVWQARDGTEALTLLAQQSFTVLVSDIYLPGVNGIDLLCAARQYADPPEVILLTGQGTFDTALAALQAGAFDYLAKPCRPEILLQRVADAVRAHAQRL